MRDLILAIIFSAMSSKNVESQQIPVLVDTTLLSPSEIIDLAEKTNRNSANRGEIFSQIFKSVKKMKFDRLTEITQTMPPPEYGDEGNFCGAVLTLIAQITAERLIDICKNKPSHEDTLGIIIQIFQNYPEYLNIAIGFVEDEAKGLEILASETESMKMKFQSDNLYFLIYELETIKKDLLWNSVNIIKQRKI